MTAGIVSPVVPGSVVGDRRPGLVRDRRPLPMAPLAWSRVDSLACGVSTVDCNGRVVDAVLLGGLGWRVGTRLDIRVRSGLVLVTADPQAVFRVTRAGQVRLPVGVRQWCGLTPGSRVLLTSDPAAGRLVIHPPATVAAMISQFHAAVLDGDQP